MFNIGDVVTIVSEDVISSFPYDDAIEAWLPQEGLYITKQMIHYCGMEVKIEYATKWRDHIVYRVSGNSWMWPESCLEESYGDFTGLDELL